MAVAVALGFLGPAGAQNEVSQEGMATCRNPHCPGIVGALQRDIEACAVKTARVSDLEDDLGRLQGKLATCSARATDAEGRAASLQAEKEKLLQQARSDAAALKDEVERLKAENAGLRQRLAAGSKLPTVPDGNRKAAGEVKELKVAKEEKRPPEASTRPPGEDGACVSLTAAIKDLCFVKSGAPGWLMARSRNKAAEGATLFLRPFIEAAVIARLPQAHAGGECGRLRDVLKLLEPPEPRPDVDAVFVRSGDAVAQCYDAGDGDWKLRPVSKSDRKHQAWILVPEPEPDAGGRP